MTVRIALYRGPAPTWWRQLAHRLVCWRTRGAYSHCELIDGEGQGWTASWMDGGVRRKAIDFGSGHWDVITVAGDLEAAVAWFRAHQGQGYDVFGLLGWVLPWRVSDRRRWFCSEAIATAMGLVNAWHISPNDLPARLGARP